MLLVVHPRDVADEPRAGDGHRPVAHLTVDGQSGDALGPIREWPAQVGEAVVGGGDAPEPGERLADDAVATAARHVGAAHGHPPRPGLLADPAHLGAERPGLAARVVQLGLGQRVAWIALGELHGLGQRVGGPVVGHGWPVVLDVVAPGREVVADAIGHLPEAVLREQPVQAGQRPVGLAGVVLRAAVGDRRQGVDVVVGDDRAVGQGHRDHEAAEGAHQLVVARVVGEQPPFHEARGQQGGPTHRRRGAVGEGGPSVVVDEAVTGPLDTAVGALQRAGDPGRRSPGTGPSSPPAWRTRL